MLEECHTHTCNLNFAFKYENYECPSMLKELFPGLKAALDPIKKQGRDRDAAQRQSTCLGRVRPWLESLVPLKRRGGGGSKAGEAARDSTLEALASHPAC